MRSGREPTTRPVLAATVTAGMLCVLASPGYGANDTVPDLSGFWEHTVPQMEWENPPSGGPGPVRRDVRYGPARLGGTGGGNIWIGDYSNPILRPWAAEAVKKEGELQLSGGTWLPASTLCLPSGVPAVFTLIGALEILQGPDTSVFLYQRDNQVRTVYLNQAHAPKRGPSYYGDSVGHYEGNTLVVDTVGMNDKTWTDAFGTPHTEALHVVEHYRVTNEGTTLEDDFTVEDPGAFTAPWSAVLNYKRARVPKVEEESCAENNRDLTVPTAVVDPISGRPLH